MNDPTSQTQCLELSVATLDSLELPALLEIVADLTGTDLGRARILDLRPLVAVESLTERRHQIEEIERLIVERPLVPWCERAFAPLVEALAGGGDLGGREIAEIAELLRISLEAAARISEIDPPCPTLAAVVSLLPPAGELRQMIRRTLDTRGEVREDASPRLTELRGRIRKVRNDLYEDLTHLVERHREHLSEETIPLRGGRLVLVLQAGARGRFSGLVHGRSGSGKSFYYEPIEVVELNNELQQSVEEEDAERRRILADLIARLVAELPALRAHAGFVAEIDSLQAAVQFGQQSRGRLAEIAEEGELILHEARHPLLDPELAELRRAALGSPGHQGPAVPLDIGFSRERRVLVVTGPNAGGKTVALKTVGLLALAHQCGLPIPAARGTRLPIFGAVVATVGDDQDLLADRSTFSGRLLRLVEAWEAASPRALLLLDELGSGTDPEEGSALAIALVEALLERGCLAFVTTHLGQLAAAALEAEGAWCAAMQFDSTNGLPTYRLLPGPPGGSEALALARRLGLPSAWIERAEQLLGSEHRDLRRLLAELDRTRRELATTHANLESELADATRLRERLVARETELVEERRTIGRRLERELEAFRRETLARLQGEVERLRDEIEQGRRKGLETQAVARLFENAPVLAPEEPETAADLMVGARVRHRQMGWQGQLEKIDRGRAQVRAAGKILRCPAEELISLDDAPASSTSRAVFRPVSPDVISPEAEGVPREINLIGQRVEPALEALDEFLDQALLAAHSEVRVVHGHGSGRLRTAIREHLRSHPGVRGHRAGGEREGGNGATVVALGAG